MNCIYITYLIISALHLISVECGDVLGCGGFIKSHVQIDFSKIEVELYTKQGILKDKTSCAPNNGYYFIPLYDKGDYVLQLQPPPGWSFNPTKVSLAIDGTSDVCSQGKDINFVFKGFGITGKVESFQKGVTGPAGVHVELKSDNDVRKTVTSADGNFFFTPVYPGKYTVSISHQRWKLFKSTVSVQVAEGNTELPLGSLVVAGYDVTGSIKSEGQPVEGVNLIIFQHDSNKHSVHVDGCEKVPFQNVKQKGKQLCHIASTAQGTFTFPTVSPGKYFIIPHYKGQNIHFQPNLIEFAVEHDSVTLSEIFEIIGFSVSGRVLTAKNGKPIKGAKVLLNGNEIAITKGDGSYSLEKIKADSYKIYVHADSLQFEENIVKVNPSMLQLPDMFPSKYQICGKVLSDKPQTIAISSITSTDVVVTQSGPPDGKFCQFLSPGKYQLQVSVNDVDKGQGIQFFPISHSLEVTSSPVSGIIFSQLKATISGKVECIREKDCTSLKVVLRPIINDVPTDTKDVIVGVTGNNAFTFKDIRPGNYEIFLTPNKLCWKTDKHVITVSSAVEVAPAFVQSGYSVLFVSSHSAKATYKLLGQGSKTQSLQIVKGRTSYCVEKPGLYNFTLESCHTYENNAVSFNTDSEINEIYLTVEKHATTVAFEAKQNFGNLFVTVNIGGTKKLEGPLIYKDKRYILTLSLRPNESAILIPQSDILYFNPPILSISGQDDCSDLGVKFIAVKGKVFQGKIIPPLSGVLITIETENSEALMDETDAEGRYKFPPQDDSKHYKISAKKDTYVLVGPNEAGDFLAHKLAEVIVEVVDQTDNLPLQGALLSLSGGESYRSNLQTNEDGKITFHSLSPSEYFLRPMMKEYSFEPTSKIIDVREGASVTVKLSGKRVAYSSFGLITSLNGEPEERITIVATGLGNCSHFSEEASSESNGQFRIRGLQPYCSYNIKVKGGLDDKRPIERAAPSSINISVIKNDVSNLKFTVFRSTATTDILVRVYSINPDIYKTLKVKLIRESSPSNLIHTAKLDSSSYKVTKDNNAGVLIQIPSVPLDDKTYSIQLEATVSQSSRAKAHTQYFVANSSFKYINLEYLTKTSTSEQNIKQTSLWTLFLIFGSLIGVYNVEQLVQFVREQLSKLNLGSITNIINSFRRKSTGTDYVIDKNEIDQIVQSINATKRKVKPRKA